MSETLTEQDQLGILFERVEGCCLHDPVFTPEDVESVLRWVGDHESQPDSQSIVLVRLKAKPDTPYWERDYGVFSQGEDYTGHGCQCHSYTYRAGSLAQLLGSMDDYEILQLLGERDDLL